MESRKEYHGTIEEPQQIKFSMLSWPLKAAVIYSLCSLVLFCVGFVIGFISGFSG